jgi:hypothetical protein
MLAVISASNCQIQSLSRHRMQAECNQKELVAEDHSRNWFRDRRGPSEF